MNKKPLSHLITKVLIGLSLFAFLIFFLLKLPQASQAALISDNAVQSTSATETSISSTSTDIASANTMPSATFSTTTISEVTYTVTMPVATTSPSSLANTDTVPAAIVVKALPATKPKSTASPATTSAVKNSTKAVSQVITIPATKPATSPITKAATKPATKPVTIPATKPVTKPATIPATKPVTKPATIPVTKPATTPATKPATQPVTKPPITAPPVTIPAPIYYRVSFVIDGTTVKAEKVLENTAGNPPAIPEKSGYSIVGWNKSVAKVTQDLTVTAVYSKNAETMPAGADEVFYVKTSSGTVKVYGTIDEADSRAAFDLVNNYRVANGVAALKWDTRYFEAAKQRAAECTISFSHTRPNGLSPVSVDTSIHITGENLAMGHGTAIRFFEAMKGSAGHNANLLKSSYKLSAIAVYKYDGYVFWAEMFGY